MMSLNSINLVENTDCTISFEVGKVRKTKDMRNGKEREDEV